MAVLLLVIIYIAFISLGLPDSLLGVSWPVMQPELGVPFGFAGFISMTVSTGTILSSLFSSRILARFGTGKVTFVSVAMTAGALAGFSFAPSYAWILLAAVPLGFGGGSVDSGLNAFVAEHYESRHMSWLHSFWGVGAVVSPLLISGIIASGLSWRSGYLTVSLVQTVLVVILLLSLPLWEKTASRFRFQGKESGISSDRTEGGSGRRKPHAPLFSPLRQRGVPFALISFFFYCGIEATVGLWGASFLIRVRNIDPAAAAAWVSLFYGSLTAGRFVTGFVTMKASNAALIRAGELIILSGVILLLLPLHTFFSLAGFVLVGLGCAPLFPCMLHETPARFGSGTAVMGFQMAVAYTGLTVLPPLFGFTASGWTFGLFAPFLLAYIVAMIVSTEKLNAMLK